MESSIPWIEKYRPGTMEELVMDDRTKQLISILVENRKNIHLIITGFPGVGKTSTVKCIAKKILGDNITDGFLELNDADTRSIKNSTVIPSFCKRAVSFKESKIILLDEADNITEKCQYDICELIKKYGHNTKFIFTCNDSTKIIEDIQSICRIIRFKKLSNEQIKDRLSYICEKEAIGYDMNGLDIICYISTGDMRKAINNLQMTAYAIGKIDKETVLKVCKKPDPNDIIKIFDSCVKQDIEKSVSLLNNLIFDGYNLLDIIIAFNYVLTELKMDENIKLKMLDVINQTIIVTSLGIKSQLQLIAMICRLINISGGMAIKIPMSIL
jgi:replication factor C subunit 2/4